MYAAEPGSACTGLETPQVLKVHIPTITPFLPHTTTDTRELGNLLTFKARHPDMSGLSAA